jgi:hypothetical protein
MIAGRVAARRASLRASIASGDHRRAAWVVTGLATAASTYALDGFAVAVGALLVASGALAGLGRPLLLAFLAVTYVAWAAGMRVNLAANWALLVRTGVSTNALSKAAHDIARARKARPRTRRWAASAAYVVWELAKEVPYYAGAFGATVVTDAVSGRDAIVFLAGTNLGAAVYEYGLARATRLFLGSGRGSVAGEGGGELRTTHDGRPPGAVRRGAQLRHRVVPDLDDS